jgi:hypothetical protein
MDTKKISKKEENALWKEKVNILKERGYFDIHKVLPLVLKNISKHFLLARTDFDHKNNNMDLFFATEIYGAWKKARIPDYQSEFRCAINKRWKYGLWINIDAKKKDDVVYTFFAMHDWAVDKFKPSAAIFTSEVTLKELATYIIDAEANCQTFDFILYDLVKFIILTKHKAISFGMYSGSVNPENNFYASYAYEWYWNEVREPFINFKDKLYTKLIIKYLSWQAKRDSRVQKFKVKDLGENCWPHKEFCYYLRSDLIEEELGKHYNDTLLRSEFPFFRNFRLWLRQVYSQLDEKGMPTHPYCFVENQEI